MFKKILIANRGEIACRIIRACQDLGVETVAVYSTADETALHTQLADEAVCIGGPNSKDSYLNMENILSAAVLTGAQAIHPGFGFLSENSKFAQMCTECNLVFIGPSAEVISMMGDKAEARKKMIEANVPVIPGSDVIRSLAEGKEKALEIGFPLLIKASAGGGGKGIRRVNMIDEFEQQYNTAKQEAANAFGNDDVYMEKIIFPAKHIEFQILADQYGHVIHLGERDCSLQRNNQKVIEEAPSPFVSEALRQQMGTSSIRAAEVVGYQNAGTIEYLVDLQGNYYFMEMNTRIQVEHPITEMITNIDLVKWQLRIASGEQLTLKQTDITIDGHSIECRLNAEDPANRFAPSPGRVEFVHFPVGGLGTRVESAIYSEYRIPPFYDSMIAKLIVRAATRELAIQKMNRLLYELTVDGVKTNHDFLRNLLNSTGFVSGEYDTKYLEQEFLPWWNKKQQASEVE